MTPSEFPDVEERLRRALTGQADAVPEPADRWAEIERRATLGRRRVRWSAAVVATLGVAAAVAVALVATPGLRDGTRQRIVVRPADTPTTEATAPPSTAVARPFAYQALWPFRSQEEAATWQRAYRADGHQAWHLDAGETALNFTRGYLGFTDIDRVIEQATTDRESHVAVGYATGGERTGTAAVIHLVRLGTGADAPWEVVGSRDSDLSVTTPRYGATATSPLVVGGRITGVDESLHVTVRQISSAAPLGEACCLPAGGEGTPWETTVAFTGATDDTLTVVVSTGGHLLGVERFAVTGVRVR